MAAEYPRLPSRQLLLVDHEVVFIQALKRHLKRYGFAMEVAPDGYRAIQQIQQRMHNGQKRPFDLVITANQMPYVCGIDVLNWIKQHIPQVAVVLVSGFGETDAIKRAVRPGIDAYLQKPFTPRQLLDVIQQRCSAAEHDAAPMVI